MQLASMTISELTGLLGLIFGLIGTSIGVFNFWRDKGELASANRTDGSVDYLLYSRALRGASRRRATMRRPRRNHTAAFKAKVAMAALKGDKTLVELSQQYDVHANQITQWKTQLQQRAKDMFETAAERAQQQTGPSVKDMQAKIGQLTLENDFLAVALGRIDDASAKR